MKTVNKLCLYSVCITMMIALTMPAWGASSDEPGITSANIKEKELKGSAQVTILKSDLADSKYAMIKGTAIGGKAMVEKVEVSLDNGNIWNDASGFEEWQYEFTPIPNHNYYLTFRVTNTDGTVSSPKAFGTTHLTYLPITLSALIQQQANELASAYMSKRLNKYMAMISRRYQGYPSGWHKLRKSIENDFRSLNSIVLRFTVNQVFQLDDKIIAEIHWSLTHAELDEPKEGDIEIHFDSTDQLKVIVQKKDLYFGEAVIGHSGRILLEENVPFVEVTVTDLDMIGEGTVMVKAKGNCEPAAPFNATMRLAEIPSRSGRFFGRRTCILRDARNYFSATYVDRITDDWRRNIRRTARITP